MSDYDYEDDYTTEDTQDIDFDVCPDCVDELQENEDFAHDGYFDNMEPTEDGFWS